MKASRLNVAVAATVLAVTAAGCGSTVADQINGSASLANQNGSTTGGSGSGHDGLGGATGGGQTGGSGGSGLGGSTSSGGGSSSSLGTLPGQSGTAGSSGQSGNSGTPGTTTSTNPGVTHKDSHGYQQGVGVTASQVFIGYGYVGDQTSGNAAIGAAGISGGDQLGEAKAVVKDINTHGGIGARSIALVPHQYSATSAQPYASQDEAACQDYTKDHHVFAVADSGVSASNVLVACLAKAGVLQTFSGDLIDHDDTFFRQYPNYTDVGTISQDRMMSGELGALARQKYFTGWNAATGHPGPAGVKIGVMTLESPEWQRPLNSILLPGLARLGHPVNKNDVYEVHPPSSYSEEGSTISGIQSAALRFRQDGVTHVIFLDANGVLALFFSKNAAGQHYYPRYGVNTATGMQALVDAGDMDPNQLRGAVGLGWGPNLDLSAPRAKRYSGSDTTHCLSVMSHAGITFSDTNARDIALSTCDKFYVLARTLRAAAPSITLGRAESALDHLGVFPSADLGSAYLAAGHHAAVNRVYDMEWNAGCNCAKYVGSPRDSR